MTTTTQPTDHLGSEELSAFIDGELSADESQRVQQHLETCHSCTLRVLSATQLKAATARAGASFTPPADAIARLTAQLRPAAPKQITPIPFRRSIFQPIAAWSSIAAALLLAVSLSSWRYVHQSNTLTAELLDQHLATLSSGAAPQVISTDRHTVKPWFQGRLPFSFNLPEPAALPPDTTLRGANLAYIEGHPAALLIFTIHKHDASVFVTERTALFSVTPRSTRSGFSVNSTTTRDLRLTAVSDVNATELNALVDALDKVQ